MNRRAETASELLQKKRSGTSGVIAVAPGDTVESALRLMARENIGAVVVLNGTELAGLMTERDYARKVELEGASARTKLVADIMTRDLIPAQPDDSIETCRRLMIEHQIRHLPVCDRGRVVGVLSIRDVLDQIILHDERHIKAVEDERLQMTTDTGAY